MDVRSRSLLRPFKNNSRGCGRAVFSRSRRSGSWRTQGDCPVSASYQVYLERGVVTKNFQDRGDVSLVRSWLVKALDDIFVRINKAAVTHQDVGLRNILIGPRRAVVGSGGRRRGLEGGRMRNGRGRRGRRRVGILLRWKRC